MQRLFNDNWVFKKFPLNASLDTILTTNPLEWHPVTLPHDWLIYDTKNLYEDGIGCYHKKFLYHPIMNRHISLLFDGVYMNSTVYVNGQTVGEWKYGYTSFLFDITDYLFEGENSILVRCIYESPNTRWYSGAGIYRDVFLVETNDVHLVHDGIYIHTQKQEDDMWNVLVQTELINETQSSNDEKIELIHRLLPPSVDLENELSNSKESPISNINLPTANVTNNKNLPTASVTNNINLPTASVTNIINLSTTNQETDGNKANFDHTLTQTISVGTLKAQGSVSYSTLSCAPNQYATIASCEFTVDTPLLWDIESPNIYQLETTLVVGDCVVEKKLTPFGFRTLALRSDQGFFLNDRPIKLHGVCMHHDLGALGSAFNPTALRRQFETLKRMGVNAIRTSHNPPAALFMQLADEMGFLIDSEAFDMWEKPKTKYDYGNFFNEWCEKDCASWIRRDRNHPSLIFWSIGNEIYDTHSERGYEITKQLASYVSSHDPYKNAFSTIGSNYIEWEGAQRCATLLDASGYNYAERLYEKHHKEHPDWVIYGSETSSTVQSRGIYHFPASHRLMTHDDHQCSSLGNCSVNWGAKNTSDVITIDRDLPFSLGQFIWTGWDYIGEPTPYFTKNSYFGQVDTAGFEKDTYYLYQAEWTDGHKNPMVHLLPYWDFNEGQLIDLRVYSNAAETELFFNDSSLGRFSHDHEHGKQLSGEWQLPYAPGTLKAVAYDEKGNVVATDIRSSFSDTYELQLIPDKTILQVGQPNNRKDSTFLHEPCETSAVWEILPVVPTGTDLIFVEIKALDKAGSFVANARDRVTIHVSGAAKLVGLDNGDSTDYDQYKGNSRRLFNGRLLAILAPTGELGEITLYVKSPSLPTATTKLYASSIANHPLINSSNDLWMENENLPLNSLDTTSGDEIPIRKISLTNLGSKLLTKENPSTKVEAKIYPPNATFTKLQWHAFLEDGIDSPFIKLSCEGNVATLTATGDGTFRLCCATTNGKDHMDVISELEFSSSGLGVATLDPYQLVPACLYTKSSNEVKLSFQGGVYVPNGQTILQFEQVDFGDYGSDEITLPIFSFDTRLPIEVFEGTPDENFNTSPQKKSGKNQDNHIDENPYGRCLLSTEYIHESQYNHYNSNTWKLKKRLRGIKTIRILTKTRLSLQGFVFTHYEKAYQTIPAIESSRITGDQFTIEEDAVTNIGNNVTLEFDHMDFSDKGFQKLTICGRTPNEKNTIPILFRNKEGEARQRIEFSRCDEYTEQSFPLNPILEEQTIIFVFLPGSQFDFKWFRFE